MKEIWKDIPQYEGLYQASSIGRIRSIDRKITQTANGGNVKFSYMKKGRVLKQTVQNGNYQMVSISINGKHRECTVHRLVASAFIDNPLNYRDVNHKNGNKTDNRVENLEWVSHGDNIRHSYHTLKQKRHYKPIICCDTGIVYSSCKEASEKTGINVGSINHAVNGISKTAGGMIWKRK